MTYILELPATCRMSAEDLAKELSKQDAVLLSEFVIKFLKSCTPTVRNIFIAQLGEHEHPLNVQLLERWDQGDRLYEVNVRGRLAARLDELFEKGGDRACIRITDPLT